MTRLRLLVSFLAYLSSACTDAGTTARIQELRDEVIRLQDSLRIVATMADSLRRARVIDQLLETAASRIVLDPLDQGFSVLESRYGPLTLRITDVQPLADGSRLRLQIGNLSAGNINGGSLKIRYGPRRAQDETFEAWESKLRDGDFSFTDDLRSGFWNVISLNLPGVPPAQLGWLRVEIGELRAITLRTR